MNPHQTTVAAISTPPGRGGVALLRISGSDAIPIAAKIFRPKGSAPLTRPEGASPVVRYGSFLDADGTLLDQGLVTVFPAPHSYTGEDVVECSCHGGVILSRRILEAIFAAGASPAGPGEFTKRAFLSGKLGLGEAEAVMDLIDAENDAQLRIAAANATGALSRKIGSLYTRLSALLAAAYVCGDYPDEDLAELSPGQMQSALQEIYGDCTALLRSYRRGHAVMEGIPCAIIGRPNAGKSSLLNALLGKNRAIVSGEEGTTRDTVEETLYLGSIRLRLIDTAGLRRGESDAERQGIDRTMEALHRAELLLGVLDASVPMDERDLIVLKELETRQAAGTPCILLLHKSDLPPVLHPEQFPAFSAVLSCSSRTGEGLAALRHAVERLYEEETIADRSGEPILASARQYAALHKAAAQMENALKALQSGFTPDVAGLDLEGAMAALRELDGREALEDVVDGIFHRFCVGK